MSRPILAAARARWPVARAALIAIALVLGLLDGCPVPPAKRTPAWARDAVVELDELRRTLLRPVAGLARDLDVQQRWALFRGASHRRFRMYVEGRTASGEWRLLYRTLDDEHAAYAAKLAYRRMRGSYAPSGQRLRSQYVPFTRWMIRKVLADHPELVAARVRMERVVIDEDGYTPTGEFAFEQVGLRGAR